MPTVDPNAPLDPNDKRGLNFAPGTGNPGTGLDSTGMGMSEMAPLVGSPGLPAPPRPDAPSDSSFLPGDVYSPQTPPAPDAPSAARTQPTGRALEDQWMNFANTDLGQVGQVGVAGGNAQDNAGAAAARNNLGGTVDAYNTKYGASAKAVGEDKIDFGDGRGPVDVIAGGGDKSQWWYGSPSETNGTGPGCGAGGGGGTGGGGGGGGPIASPTGGWTGTTPGQGSALYDALLKRSQQSLAVDPNDPIIRGQTDANNVQLNRARTQYLQQEAERGGSNANISNEERSSAEQVGQAGADFQSKLMGQELAARRTEIQNALTGQAGLLTSEQQMQLQEELAQLQRAESHYQFNQSQGQQESQFGRTLGQRGYEFDSNDTYRNSPLGS
jgi:hypothetical protein